MLDKASGTAATEACGNFMEVTVAVVKFFELFNFNGWVSFIGLRMEFKDCIVSYTCKLEINNNLNRH